MTLEAHKVLFWLIVGHFAMDYPFQGDTTAIQKSPLCNNPLSKLVPWYYWMTAHCLMQAGVVMLVTGSIKFALFEFVVHFVTDYTKCRNWISIHLDQGIHLACKLSFAILIALDQKHW